MAKNRKIRNICILLLALFFLNSISSVSALSLIVHVPEKYIEVTAGERFYFEIEVKYPENPSRKDLQLEYEILTESGDLISQSKTLKAVETQASFIDFIVIPASAKGGLHFINVKIKDYEALSEKTSSNFQIKKTGGDQIMIYLLIILAVVILTGVLVIVSIVITRKK
ncbi:hypothetical protein KAS08_05440 [Candidatus Pacearchaeota archaeon]|nr:hypothetical protein [Candidatus Pacearchaeota archaeon]